MKLSDKLQIEINQARERALELANIDDPTEKDRDEIKELRGKLETLTERHSTAIEAEQIETAAIAEDDTAMDAEEKEVAKLMGMASLSTYVRSAADEHEVQTGVEAELNAALQITQPSEFPMQLLVDWNGDERIQEEERVDAVTNLTIDTTAIQSTYLLRMLANSNAMHLGVTTRSVGPGVHVYPYVGGTSEAGTPAVTTAQDAPAATVTTVEHKPKAVHTRYLITEEDRMRLGGAYEGALRTDLRNQLMSKLDDVVFNTATDGLLAAVTASPDAALAAATTHAQAHGFALLGIDGIYAHSLSDIKMSLNPESYRHMATLAPSNTAAYLTDYLESMGCSVRANAHIGDITGNDGESYLVTSKARGLTGAAILSVWSTGKMVLDATGANLQARQVALDVVGFWDFNVIRTASFTKSRYSAHA